MPKKILNLLRHPSTEYKKIVPFFAAFTTETKRRLNEILGNDKYLIVYEGHDDLMKQLGSKKYGFFIECGANNGQRSDPTYFLEKKLGWKGILVEPLEGAYNVCAKIRKDSAIYNCALVSKDYPEQTVKLIDCKLMSVVKGLNGYEEWIKDGERVQKIKSREIEVPARTLDSVISEYFLAHPKKPIDLLVIDTEGYEINILKGFDLDMYKPQHLLIEIQNESRKNEIENYLGKRYLLVSKIGFADYLYKKT